MKIRTAVDVQTSLPIQLRDLLTASGLTVEGNVLLSIHVEEIGDDYVECSLTVVQAGEDWEKCLYVHFDSVFPDFIWEGYAVNALDILRAEEATDFVKDFLAAIIAEEGRLDVELDEDHQGNKILEFSVVIHENTPRKFETKAVFPLDQAKAAGLRVFLDGEEV